MLKQGHALSNTGEALPLQIRSSIDDSHIQTQALDSGGLRTRQGRPRSLPWCPSLVLRWQRQWNQRAVTLRPPPVLKSPGPRDTLFPEPLTPTYPTSLWIEFPWCSEGLTSLRGRVSGFQGLRGIAHSKREDINGAPTLDPQLQENSGVPLKLLLSCHVLKTKDCKPAVWVPDPAYG